MALPTDGTPEQRADRFRDLAAREIDRRNALRFGMLGIGGFSVAALLAACTSSNGEPSTKKTAAGSGSASATAKPKAGGDLILARAQDAVSMDKTMVFSNASIWVFHQIFERLTSSTDDGRGVQPWLATSWSQSADKLSWTFKLRKGVKFSDGTPMTAADVKFSIDESGKTKGGWEFINSAIASVTAPSDDTVVIKTKYPWAPLLADLACPSNGIVPKNYAGKTKANFYKAPVGTGPFMWDTWDKGSKLTLKKNPNYWDAGKPYLNSVTWQVVPDDNSRGIMIQGNTAQIDENPPFSTVQQLKSVSGATVKLFPSTRTDYILMNEKQKPYDDVHVRRAIAYAIDRAALVKTVLFGNGTPANSIFMPTVPYYDKNTPGLEYDMDKAKAELAKSSVPHGFSTTFLAASGDSVDAAIAQVLQSSLKDLGITMKISNSDPSAVHDLQNQLKYQISHSYWTMDIADPDELVQFAVIPSSGGHSFLTDYDDKPTQKIAIEAQKTFDTTQRQKLYSQLQASAAESAFLIPLFYQPFPYGLRSNVQGFFVQPTGLYHMGDVSLA